MNFKFMEPIFGINYFPKSSDLDEISVVLYSNHRDQIYVKTDRLFGVLFVFQYILGIIFAITISPRAWNGIHSHIHPHVWISLILGFILISFPLFLICKLPGRKITRYTIAVTQILTSTLLIHLTGGRIETHFHIFGSLAFLAIYRDWRVLIIASIVTTLDHIIRGIYWPLSIYGVISGGEWRWLEHAGWVIFEDIFLIYACLVSVSEMKTISIRDADNIKINDALIMQIDERIKTEKSLQLLQDDLEHRIVVNTAELIDAYAALQKELDERKHIESQLIQAQKMESIGQLAAGVAHEINNPVCFVKSNLVTFQEYISILTRLFGLYQRLIIHLNQETNAPEILEVMDEILILDKKDNVMFVMTDMNDLIKESLDGTLRIEEIVKNLKSFSRLDESIQKISNLHEGIETTIKVIWNELKYKCKVIKNYGNISNIYCNPGQLNQVFMNLLLNAAQAIEENGSITIETSASDSEVTIIISDTGMGMSEEVLSKIFNPFFTTKDIGKGTGLGLSVSYNIIQSQGGQILVSSKIGEGASFVIKLPIFQSENPE